MVLVPPHHDFRRPLLQYERHDVLVLGLHADGVLKRSNTDDSVNAAVDQCLQRTLTTLEKLEILTSSPSSVT